MNNQFCGFVMIRKFKQLCKKILVQLKTIIMKLLLFASLIILVSSDTPATSVKLSVYYESMCPDSIRFITTQLFSNWKYFGSDVLNVDLHPFGKSNVRFSNHWILQVECLYVSSLLLGLVGISHVNMGQMSVMVTWSKHAYLIRSVCFKIGFLFE